MALLGNFSTVPLAVLPGLQATTRLKYSHLIVLAILATLSITLAIAGVAVGFSRQPASGIGAAILVVVVLPYALVLWWALRRQIARASALAFGSALVAFFSLVLFAGVFTLFLGFAMGNKDQIYFAWTLDVFVMIQLPLAVVAWRAWRRLPVSDRAKGCWVVGAGLPLAIAAGLLATYNGVKFGTENRVETIQRNEQSAREAMAAAMICLKRHADRNAGYPADFRALGGNGDRCLDDQRIAGDLPSHRLHYAPGIPNAEGHILLYGLCAEATGFGKSAWRTYVADETEHVIQYEPREGMTRGPTCGEAWSNNWGNDWITGLAGRVKYCAVDYSARFPAKGYPTKLDSVGSHPGTGCLAPSQIADVRVEGGTLVSSREQQVRYQAGTPDEQGRTTSFEIHGEELLDRWRVKVMVDETGQQHVAEARDARRDDPSPEAFMRILETREAERAAVLAEEKSRCAAGDAKLCRTLGAASFDARKDSDAQSLWQTGCDKGDGVSCLLALNPSDFRFFLANSLRNDCLMPERRACARLEKLGNDFQACERGDQAGCSGLAIRFGQRGDTFNANKLWEKSCAAGRRESCYLLKARDFEYKVALQLKDLCDEGQRDACREFEQRMTAFLTAAQ